MTFTEITPKLPELFIIGALAVLSWADLRYRLVPAIEVFFLVSVFLSAWTNPLFAIAIVLAVAWGWIASWPSFVVWLLLFVPSAWGVLLIGYGVRKRVIGRADLLAVGALACLFPWYALMAAFVGLELWRRWWVKRWGGMIPALPGLLLGLAVYWILSLALPI